MSNTRECPRNGRRVEIVAALVECASQIAYWTMRRAQAELRDDRVAATARLLAWQSNKRCQVAALKNLTGEVAA